MKNNTQEAASAQADNRVCVICDGGPGNECACSCGFQKWEATSAQAERGVIADAADLLDQYAEFIRRDVKADDLERHPYLPLIEETAAALRAVDAPPKGGGQETEPFGYWIEQKNAEPILLRKPAYIPQPSDIRSVTPLYTRPVASSHSVGFPTVTMERPDLEEIRRSMVLLQMQAEHGVHQGPHDTDPGLPGWLLDTKASLEVLTDALYPSPSPTYSDADAS
jgi:hypothetical protein